MVIRVSWPFPIFPSFQSSTVLSIALIFSLTACGTPYANLYGPLKIDDYAWRETDLNIEEAGWHFKWNLAISGLKGVPVPVRIFSSDDTVLMGEVIVTPTYDSSHWDEFSIFIPLSKLTQIAEVNGAVNVYVVWPSNPVVYLTSERPTWGKFTPEKSIWKLKEVRYDVDVGSGAKGIKVRFDLEITHRVGERLEIIPLLNGHSVPHESHWNRITFEQGIPPSTHERGIYKDLMLIVPYDALDRLVSASDIDTITIGPAIRHNGQIEVGNVRLRLPPAGTLERQVNVINQTIKSVEETIKYLEKQSDILSRDR